MILPILIALGSTNLAAANHAGALAWFSSRQVNPEAVLKPGDREKLFETRRVVRLSRHHHRKHRLWVASKDKANSDAHDWQHTVAAPTRQTVQTVALRVNDTHDVPVAGLALHIDVNHGEKLVATRDVTTTKDGIGRLKITSFPCYLSISVPGDQYEIVDPDRTVLRLAGNEGRVAVRAHSGLLAQAQPFRGIPGLCALGAAPGFAELPAQGSQPKVVTIQRVYDAPTIVVEPTQVTYKINTTPNSTVSIAGQSVATTDDKGQASVTLPTWRVSEGEHPDAVITKDTDSASFTKPISLPDPDPSGGDTTVSVPELPLVAVKKIQLNQIPYKDLMLWASDVQQMYGKPKEEPYREGIAGDGSKWWRYDSKGLWFKVRDIVGANGKSRTAVERVRITDKDGGSIGDLAVGTDRSAVTTEIGDGEPSDDPIAVGKRTYASNGIVIQYTPDNKIEYIELRRSEDLLKTGMELQASRARTKVYLAPVRGEWEQYPDAASNVQDWMRSIPGIEYVDDPDKADFSITLGLGDLSEKREEVVNGIPFAYDCTTNLTGQVQFLGADENAARTGNLNYSGSSSANFERDVAEGAVLLIALAIVLGLVIKNNTLRAAALLIIATVGVVAIRKMPDIMTRAGIRARSLAMRDATQALADQLQKAATFTARVKAIDYAGGTLTINAGSNQGIQEGTEFVLRNGSIPIRPMTMNGLKRDLTVARVVTVSADESTCKVFHISHTIDSKVRERYSEKEDPRSLNALLEPSTGMPQASMIFRIGEPQADE